MNLSLPGMLVCALICTAAAAENAVLNELLDAGVKMSDGSAAKLPPPILADGLDSAGQQAALAKAADDRHSVEDLLKKSYYSPVVVKVRTVKPFQEEQPAVRAVDLWFVAHGRWETLTSEEFLESALGSKDTGPSRVVLRSGILNKEELAERKLSVASSDDREERFVYATFVLFERVEISATRFSVLNRSQESILAAARLDPRFLDDPDYPNQWRPLLRDERAEIKPGPAQPLANAGGYAKITRLKSPADAVFVECHLVYEEPYGWFEGVNLIKQKLPVMVQEKVKTFRRKLATADVK